MNMSDTSLNVELPEIKGKKWCLAVDTSLSSPYDIVAPQQQQYCADACYSVAAKSVVVFENK
jgi:glycogen operon protein